MTTYAQQTTKPSQGATGLQQRVLSPMTARPRTAQTPSRLGHGAAVGLQRRVEGREAVQRKSIDPGYGDLVRAASALRSHGAVVQAKLTLGHTGDPLEHEADRVADTVLRMPPPGSAGARVQRKCATCAEEDTKMPQVQRKCAACAAEPMPAVQRNAVPSSGAQDAPAMIEQTLHSSTGAPLDAGARAFFEPRFGRDFSAVRVHTGALAASSARAVSAEAYTVGRNIVFRQGAFEPGADRGRRLLAHELTHVVQQGAAPPAPDGGAHDAAAPRAATAGGQAQRAIAPLVQRKLVVNPADSIPLPVGVAGPPQPLTNAVQGLINSTCPSGGFSVDAGTGVVSANPRFCEWHPPLLADKTEADLSPTPAGCRCLCDVVNNAHTTTIGFRPGGPSTSPGSVAGAGAGQGGVQTDATVNADPRFQGQYLIGGKWVDVPFYLLLAHEVCGHALPKMQGTHVPRGPTPAGGTPPQEQHAVDVERDIAAEGGQPRRPNDYSGGARQRP
jgi:hypothetical protein